MSSSQIAFRRGTVSVVTLLCLAFLALCEIAYSQGAAQGTVAVFPFANISGQPEDDWLGAGIAETVATDFEGLSGLSVVGRAVAPQGSWTVV